MKTAEKKKYGKWTRSASTAEGNKTSLLAYMKNLNPTIPMKKTPTLKDILYSQYGFTVLP